MRILRYAVLGLVASLVAFTGCETKKTRTVTVEGPEKKTEVKVETTEKDHD